MNGLRVSLVLITLVDLSRTSAPLNSCDLLTETQLLFCRCDSLRQNDADSADCRIYKPLAASNPLWSSFQNQLNLTKLKLDVEPGGRLNHVPSRIFSWLHKLVLVEILNADIKEIQARAFSSLTQLEEINLTRNKIIEVNRKSFQNATKLRILTLSMNEIEHLEKGTFSGLKNLESLHLDSNEIGSIPDGLFKDLVKLNDLDLSSNQIEALTRDSFSGLSQLRVLSLTNNQIELLEDQVFVKYTGKLQHLNLRSNRLKIIKSSLFAGLEHLEYLNLRDNEIFQINSGAWRKLPSLSYLDLKGNQLIYLDAIHFNDIRDNLMNSSTAFALEGNPLECACDFNWFAAVQRETKSVQVREMLSHLVCQIRSVQMKISDYLDIECPEPTTTTSEPTSTSTRKSTTSTLSTTTRRSTTSTKTTTKSTWTTEAKILNDEGTERRLQVAGVAETIKKNTTKSESRKTSQVKSSAAMFPVHVALFSFSLCVQLCLMPV